jgi:hypothetical protein
MQKGCALLFEKERLAAPASTALAHAMMEADRKVLNFPAAAASRRMVRPAFFSIGVATAAACLALVLLRPFDKTPSAASFPPAAASVPAFAPPAPSSVGSPASGFLLAHETLLANPLPRTTQQAFAFHGSREIGLNALDRSVSTLNTTFARTSSAGLEATDALSLAWARELQLRPIRKISTEEFLSEKSRTAPSAPETILFHPPADLSEEMAAFQFQR